jgi:uncharacterized protein YjiS (DUF1127 family)
MSNLTKDRLSPSVERPIWRAMAIVYLEGIMSIIAPDVVAFHRIYPRLSSYRPTGLTSWLGRLLGTWRRRIRERQAFARLDYRELRDIGLSRWDVERELAKPFWRG